MQDKKSRETFIDIVFWRHRYSSKSRVVALMVISAVPMLVPSLSAMFFMVNHRLYFLLLHQCYVWSVLLVAFQTWLSCAFPATFLVPLYDGVILPKASIWPAQTIKVNSLQSSDVKHVSVEYYFSRHINWENNLSPKITLCRSGWGLLEFPLIPQISN